MGDTVALSTRFNKASRKIHNISDALVNTKLIALLTDQELYAKALSRFYYVLTALERALDEAQKKGDVDLGSFRSFYNDMAMYRAAAFRADLEYLLGPHWEVRCGPKSTPLQEYERHLNHLAFTQPRLLLAHSFAQHLAITAGGQAVRRIVRKYLALPEGAGTAAFDFKGESSNTLKSKFKVAMDEWGLRLSEDEVQQLISEHLTAFQYNNAIIRAFPIPLAAVLKGVLRITPRLVVVLAALALLVALAVPWVVASFRQASAAM